MQHAGEANVSCEDRLARELVEQLGADEVLADVLVAGDARPPQPLSALAPGCYSPLVRALPPG
jgi:hypothetical protein